MKHRITVGWMPLPGVVTWQLTIQHKEAINSTHQYSRKCCCWILNAYLMCCCGCDCRIFYLYPFFGNSNPFSLRLFGLTPLKPYILHFSIWGGFFCHRPDTFLIETFKVIYWVLLCGKFIASLCYIGSCHVIAPGKGIHPTSCYAE